MLLMWRLFTSLDRKENALLSSGQFSIRADVHRTGVGRLSLHYSSQITIYEASADPSSLVIMIIFIGFLIPVMLFYNLYQYIVFVAKWSLWRLGSATEHDSTCEPRAAPITTHHK